MAVASIRLKSTSFAKLVSSQTGNLQSPIFCQRRQAHESSQSSESNDNHEITKADMKQANEAINEKNIEEGDMDKQTVASILPEEVIEQSENFWVPDPETGVFVPPEEIEGDSNGNCLNPHHTGNGPSILDQTVCVTEEEMEEVQIDEPMDRKAQE